MKNLKAKSKNKNKNKIQIVSINSHSINNAFVILFSLSATIVSLNIDSHVHLPNAKENEQVRISNNAQMCKK